MTGSFFAILEGNFVIFEKLFPIFIYLFIYFLVTLWVPSVTRYAFFDGIHISHTYCAKIILATVNYFMYHVRDENK